MVVFHLNLESFKRFKRFKRQSCWFPEKVLVHYLPSYQASEKVIGLVFVVYAIVRLNSQLNGSGSCLHIFGANWLIEFCNKE